MPPFDAPGNGPAQAAQEIRRELLPGERVLWSGRPAGGLRFGRSDLVVTAFGLAWCAAVGRWWSSAVESGDDGQAGLAVVPGALVGLYLLVGHTLHEAWRRGRTWYALTGQRLVLVTGRRWRRVTSLQLGELPAAVLREGPAGLGTISFSLPSEPRLDGDDRERPSGVAARLELLAEPRRVLEAIQAAQRAARGGGPFCAARAP